MQVAYDLGISEVYVRKLESGAVKPGRDTMFKFENYYNVSAKKLFPDIFLDINDKKVTNDEKSATSA
jgi:transcriptional regulator with XRE-family HTH domain